MHKRKGALVDFSALVSLKLCIFFAFFPTSFYPFLSFFLPSLTLLRLLLSFYILLYLLFILFYPFSTVCCLIPLFTIPQSFISYSFILIRPFYVFISLYPFYLLFLPYPCSYSLIISFTLAPVSLPFFISLLYLLLFLFMCSRCSDLIF